MRSASELREASWSARGKRVPERHAAFASVGATLTISRDAALLPITKGVTHLTPFPVSVSEYGRVTSTARYNASGPPGGQVFKTTYGYDAHARQNTATDARNGATSYVFNSADQVTTTIYPDPGTGSQVLTTFYDQLGRVIGLRQPNGNVTTNFYFPSGLLQKTSGSRVYPVEYSYDSQGRTRTMTTWTNFPAAGSAVTTWNYNQYRGWLDNKRYADPGTGLASSVGPDYTYTPGARLRTRLWARVGTGGQRITATYAYGFDGASGYRHADLTGVTYANDPAATPALSHSYDRRGRRSQVVQGSITTALAYNDANLPLSETYTGGLLGGFSVSSGYNSLLQRTSLSLGGITGSYSVGYSYDTAGRLGTVTHGTATATYGYIANSPLVGQITSVQGNTTVVTTKLFDRLNRLQSISTAGTAGGAAVGQPLSFSYGYNNANQRFRMDLSDGSYWVYNYDSLGQVVSGRRFWQDGTPVAGQQFDYAFDTIGNRKSASMGGDSSGGGLRTAAYTTDRLNRYAQRTVPGYADVLGIANPTASVTVNANTAYRKGEYFHYALPIGNSSAAQYPLVTVASTYPPGQQDSGNVFLPRTPEQFGYDADGNLTSDGRWNYTWDAENRLTRLVANTAVGPQQRIDFNYDWQSRRIAKTVWNNTGGTGNPVVLKKFLYDAWNLLGEIDALNPQPTTLIRSYIWGSDLSGSMQGAGGVGGLLMVWDLTTINGQPSTHFVAYDGNGNVAGLLNSQGATASASYEYGPFGELIRSTGPMADANPVRFSTKYQDAEDDLLYASSTLPVDQ